MSPAESAGRGDASSTLPSAPGDGRPKSRVDERLELAAESEAGRGLVEPPAANRTQKTLGHTCSTVSTEPELASFETLQKYPQESCATKSRCVQDRLSLIELNLDKTAPTSNLNDVQTLNHHGQREQRQQQHSATQQQQTTSQSVIERVKETEGTSSKRSSLPGLNGSVASADISYNCRGCDASSRRLHKCIVGRRAPSSPEHIPLDEAAALSPDEIRQLQIHNYELQAADYRQKAEIAHLKAKLLILGGQLNKCRQLAIVLKDCMN